MHVIWKRPDGFIGAKPSDYYVFAIGDTCNIWLHRTNNDWYPLQISGGWSEADMTQKINNLVNLLPKSDSEFISFLEKMYNDSPPESLDAFYEGLDSWFKDLKMALKGDKWEQEILQLVIDELEGRVKSLRDPLGNKIGI